MATKVGMISLGCCKNRVDSEVLLGMLAKHGYEDCFRPRRGGNIFVNTCGFIESAKEESIDSHFEMADTRRRAGSKSCS